MKECVECGEVKDLGDFYRHAHLADGRATVCKRCWKDLYYYKTKGKRNMVATTKARHGKRFFEDIGALGGSISRGGGFANNPKLASAAGKIGGKRSKRGRSMRYEDIPQRPSKQSWFKRLIGWDA